MSMIINTNMASLNAQRQLAMNQFELDKSMQRLTSGKRINTSSDDAAGLQLSNVMTSQIKGLNQAVRNANDGISMLQVAEGALDETTNILQRMRELSIQSASGTYTDQNRATLNAEYQQLIAELDRISDTTSFNGLKILNGSADSVELQVGSLAEETLSFNLQAIDSNSLGVSGGSGGDLVGAQLNLSSDTGKFATDLSHAIMINGQNLGGIAEGSSVDDLLEKINNNIAGVTATTHLEVVASSVGDGVLSGADKLTLQLYLHDGSEQNYTIQYTNSLEELSAKITEVSGGVLSSAIDDEGKLQITSDEAATILIQDSTSGVASGIDTGSIEDPGIANIIEGLQSFWISEAETRITDFFGLTGSGNIELNLFTDAQYGQLASVSFTMVNPATGHALDLNLNIDLADYGNVTMPDGDNGGLFSLDRVIAHEMVHAVMAVTMDITKAGDGLRISDDKDPFPGWFTEGVAELIHGADDRVNQENTYIDTEAELQALFDETKEHGSPSSPGGYSVAYLAAKMLQDDIYANDTDGISLLFDRLELGDSLDEAIVSLNGSGKTQFTNLNDFETHFRDNGFEYLTGAPAGVTSTLDLVDADTGSIAGSDYAGAVLNATDVFANSDASGPANDFTLVIPDEYSGNYFTADARLVLDSDDGQSISVTKSATASDVDLEHFGFAEIENVGSVVGQGLSSDEQQTTLGYNDLIINGVGISPVTESPSLLKKVDAINAAYDETGVLASVVSQEGFSYQDISTAKEYATSSGSFSLAAGGLWLNGVGIGVALDDGAAEVAASVNATTSKHGAQAYVDQDGNLHFFSEKTINFGGTSAVELVSFGLAETGGVNSGSIRLNNIEVSLTDITNLQQLTDEINLRSSLTSVTASLEGGQINLSGNGAVNVGLGDTNGLRTLEAIGISFGINGDENLTDTDSDGRFGNETYLLESRIKLESISGSAISVDVTANGKTATGLLDLNTGSIGGGVALSSQHIATQSAAQKSISALDNALDSVNNSRAEIGAVLNRLDFTISNLENISENTAASRSRILDADFAKESASLSRAQILSQAGSAMLAQANTLPQQVLQLLR
ncbi:flagellinolysin [Neptuniibacter sp. QD37_6]|uniref:flagellinolysin n=1 Tax=Neptuniibacter sp. QD37_6 TaxID=3398210 RepID=UPI0039F5B75D